MNLVDSCGWLEYLADGPNARFFATAIEDSDSLLVPTICIFEVYRCSLRQRGRRLALDSVGSMRTGRVVSLDLPIALAAAEVGMDTGLPLADAIILATARAHGATLWTQDADFKGIKGVRYPKRK